MDVNLKGTGRALIEAIRKGDKEIVELLLEKGADINVKSELISTSALEEAIKKGDEEILDLINGQGTDVINKVLIKLLYWAAKFSYKSVSLKCKSIQWSAGIDEQLCLIVILVNATIGLSI